MTRYLAAYAALAFTMIAIDMLWLGVIARPLYTAGIGHLMAEKPVIPAAVLFYLIYALGLLIFGVLPFDAAAGWTRPLLTAAAFGFFAYATYDLTNLATLKGWPWTLAALDMAWGTLISVVAAAAGRVAWLHFAPHGLD
jgi:uncharacterized membrane protein